MILDTVVWAVARGDEAGKTRPARLVRALQSAGFLNIAEIYTHGARTKHACGEVPMLPKARSFRSPLAGARLLREKNCALLSPSAAIVGVNNCAWMDAYDDWSIAPDIPMARRLLAQSTYAQLSEDSGPKAVTVNTPYMAARLGTPHVIPNGVDSGVARLPTDGDARARVLVLGSLHHGRLSKAAASALSRLPASAQIVVAGPDTGMVRRCLAGSRADVIAFNYLTTAELAGFVGPRTVAFLPLRVSDYTLSQDPMKLYEFLALGVPVVMPRLLWPVHLPMDRAVLFDYDDDICGLVDCATNLPSVTIDDRTAFAREHSWERRAAAVMTVLRHSNAL